MTGDPGPIIVASLHAFGVRSFDTAAALTPDERQLQRRHHAGQPDPRAGRAATSQRSYIHEDPSDSLEYSASDFAVAQFAQALGDTAHVQHVHAARAVVAQRVQHRVAATSTTATPTARGRGRWTRPARAGYTEGNAVAVHLDGHLQLRRR